MRRTAPPPVTLSQTVPPPRSKWTFSSRSDMSGLFINLFGEMTQRFAPRRDLHDRRKLRTADVLNLVASWSEWTTRREIRRIGRQSRDLEELSTLRRGTVRHRHQQASRIRICRPLEKS